MSGATPRQAARSTGSPALDNLRRKAGVRDYRCGICGEEFGSNLPPHDIQCTNDACEARLCPGCGEWFSAEGVTVNHQLAAERAAREPHAADGDVEAAFASGARVRTGPCTADGHDGEHFQVRTNAHWLCGHLLASLLIAQGIVANPEPQPAPELATVDLHRWYAVIHQPDGTSKVIGHTNDGLGYYDSVDEWEAKNS